MKKTLFLVSLFFATLPLLSAPRQPKSIVHRNKPNNVVYVPVPANQTQEQDPLERDKEIDQQLMGHFITILGNFGKILVDPHDEKTVTTNVGHMINNIVSVAQTVMQKTRSDRKNFAQRLSLALIKYFQYQAYLQQQKTQQHQHH